MAGTLRRPADDPRTSGTVDLLRLGDIYLGFVLLFSIVFGVIAAVEPPHDVVSMAAHVATAGGAAGVAAAFVALPVWLGIERRRRANVDAAPMSAPPVALEPPRRFDAADLGTNLRRLRAERGYTQEQVAERAGLQIAAFSRVERGEVDARYSTVTKIAAALEVRLEDLLR